MKLNTELSHDAEYIGDIQENRVGIDRSNIDFITTLLTSNLYSKPLESFLRETISNAYDSHVEAGTDEYILLLIEDVGYHAYNISIRDYGTGVSPERFDLIYKNIGSSTKRESNDYIGMFGIGRLSALSVVDVASITSYYNGKKYSYIMYKNGSGINIDKISEIEGDFKNGLEVSIKKDNINATDLADALKYLCLFDKLHIVYKGENYFLKNNVENFNNRKTKRYKTFTTCSILPTYYTNYFRVGNVIYKDTNNFIKEKLNIYEGYIVNLPIGSVDITPSREELQYTDYTINTINSQLLEVIEEFKEIASSLVQSDMTLSKFYSDVVQDDTYTVDELVISKLVVPIDVSNCTIDGCAIPYNLYTVIKSFHYHSIDRKYVYKTYFSNNRRGNSCSLRNVFSGKVRLIEKVDKVTKATTFAYLNELMDTNHLYLMLFNNGWEDVKKSLKSYCSNMEIDLDDFNTCMDFIYDHIGVLKLSNADVPEDFIKEYKEKQKKKKEVTVTNKNNIPLRLYYGNSYRNTTYDYYRFKKGVIIYTNNTKEDQTIRSLASLLQFDEFVSGVITVKAEYLDMFKSNRRFIRVDDFLYLKNNYMLKLVTAYIIYNNFKKQFRKYNISGLYIPLYQAFIKKYRNQYKCVDHMYYGYDKFLEGIVQYYQDKGWINQYEIDCYSLSDTEWSSLIGWRDMIENKEHIIKKLALKKFGVLPNIGLSI